jgi:hypothetical protein
VAGKLAGTAGILAAGAVAVAAYVLLRLSEEKQLLAKCEEILVVGIKSPSTYELIWVRALVTTEAEMNQRLAWDLRGKKLHDVTRSAKGT